MHSSKRENPILAHSPGALKSFVLASRPKTWIAGLSPVLIGGALAQPLHLFHWMCCLFFSLFIQIGTNFANDYFDAIQGADTPDRIGPARAVANGWLSPSSMRWAYRLLFALAIWVSWPLISLCGLPFLGWVLSAVTFGIFYTKGPIPREIQESASAKEAPQIFCPEQATVLESTTRVRAKNVGESRRRMDRFLNYERYKPLGYLGLGDLLVLFYFGPVAVGGTYYVQHLHCPLSILICSFAPGLLSTAILIANNLRDEASDRKAGKKTLVVRWGKRFGQIEYSLCLLGAFAIPSFYGFWLHWLLLPLGGLLLKQAWSYREAKEIASLLPKTALCLMGFTLLFCVEAIAYGIVKQ
jgi:1,4-dihydroxy-2-naphthoate octaprenyltransferase